MTKNKIGSRVANSALSAIAFVIACGAAAPPVAAEAASQKMGRALVKVVGRGYYALSIPRSDFSPGTVLIATVKKGVLAPESIVCSRALVGGVDPTKDTGINIPDIDLTDEYDLTFALGFLNKILGTGNSAKIGSTDAKFKKSVKVTWGEPTEDYYTLEQITPKSMSQTCVDTINKLSASQRANLIVIERAVSVNAFQYEQKPEYTGGASAGGSWQDVLTVEANAKWSVTGKRSLKITSPRYVLVNAPSFATWAKLAATSAGPNKVTFKLKYQPTQVIPVELPKNFPVDPADR